MVKKGGGELGCENKNLTTAHHDLCDSFCHRFIHSTSWQAVSVNPQTHQPESEETDLSSDYCQLLEQPFSDSKQGKKKKKKNGIGPSDGGGVAGGGGGDYNKSSNSDME